MVGQFSNLGLELASLGERVFAQRLNQLKFVERIVRPVRANTARKRKMRDELLAHLTAIYDEELDRLHDPTAAQIAAVERFGEPAELTRELEAALPRSARREYAVERWFGWRPPETAAYWTLRLALQLFVLLVAICAVGMIAPMLIAPWAYWQWKEMRGIVAFVVALPTSFALLGPAYFHLRDALFGVFGTRKSWFVVGLIEIAVVLTVTGLGVGFVAFSTWDLVRARDFIVPYGAAGVAIAMGMLVLARWNGPTEIRDALWECLDIDDSAGRGVPPVELAG
jgi:ATP-dependent Clp protease ATP-binding subunit ClpC